jgi:hypothetical protein
MRFLSGLIMIVYLTGMANELSVTPESKWSEASRSELVKSVAQKMIRALEWPVSAFGRITVANDWDRR